MNKLLKKAEDVAHDMLRKYKLTQGRFEKLVNIYIMLTPSQRDRLRIEDCVHGGGDVDRYGKSSCRVGQCQRIGFGHDRDRDGKHFRRYQLWAVWSPKEE